MDKLMGAEHAATLAYTFNPCAYTHDSMNRVMGIRASVDIFPPDVWIDELLDYHGGLS